MYDLLDDDYDSFGDTEDINAFDDGEFFDESARTRRMAQQRAKVRALARSRANGRANRQAPQKPRNVREAFSKVGNDLQKVNLQSRVNTDLLGTAVKSQGTRISRAETSQTLSKVWDEFRTLYPNAINDPTIKSLFSLAPLLFLKPQKRGQGIGSIVTDPRIWGPAAIAGFALYSKFQKKYKITLGPANPQTNVGGSVQLTMLVRDSSGNAIIPAPPVNWTSSDATIATVANGVVTGVKAGTAYVLATIAGSNDSEAIAVEIK